MDWRQRTRIQASYEAQLSDKNLVLFDVQTDSAPTEPLLHRESRFLYVLSGQGKIRIQQSIHEMRPGVLLALQPWQLSEIIQVDAPLTYNLLIYKFDAINYLMKHAFNLDEEPLELISPLHENSSIQVPPEDQPRIEAFFRDIREEVGICSMNMGKSKKKYSTIYLLARMMELITYYCRAIAAGSAMPVAPLPKDGLPLENLFQYIYFNLSRELSLSNLSAVFHRSESSLSKYIYQVTGLGFRELLFEMKSMKIEFLLLHTNLTLEQIALVLNLSDAAQVSKVFSEGHDLNAGNYRELHQSLWNLVDIPADDQALPLIAYISDHYAEDLNIVDVAKHFSLSSNQVNRILKYYVELNFSNFLKRVRISKACDLLLHTDHPIIDIALMVGFGSSRTLTRNFVKLLSITPSEFRKKTFDGY